MRQVKLIRAGAAALALCLSFLSLTGFARSGFEGEPLQDVPLTLGESSDSEPPPILECICKTKCTKVEQNEDCPVCILDYQDCGSTEPEPIPICVCETQCQIGTVKEDCPVCVLNLSHCVGKKPEKSEFTISILPPSGWKTQTADIEIRIEDEKGNGFSKVETKIEKSGKWIDITDDIRDTGNAFLEISENCTVYVTVTDRNENTYVKSRYMECFDRENPTVRAELNGELLRVEATDTLSGVEYVYINGTPISGFANGIIDVRLRDLIDGTFTQVEILSVDYAGNKSKMLTLKNPLYQTKEKEAEKKNEDEKLKSEEKKEESPKEEKQEITQAPSCPETEVSKPQTTEEAKPTVITTPSFSSPVSRPQTTTPTPSPAPSTSTTPTAGTGNVIENSEKSSSQREFFTIETAAGNIFYIVVDKEKQSENVYLLTAATETELQALAEKSSGKVEDYAIPEPEPLPKPEPEPKPEPKPEPTPEPEVPAKPENNHSALLLIIILAIGCGAGYYFKVYKPKQDLDDADDWDDIEFENEPTINEDISALEGDIESDTIEESSENQTGEDY